MGTLILPQSPIPSKPTFRRGHKRPKGTEGRNPYSRFESTRGPQTLIRDRVNAARVSDPI